MKKYRSLILLIIFVFSITGCAAFFEDVKISQAIDQGLIQYGMTQEEVEEAIGIKYNWYRDNYYTDKYITRWEIGGGSGGTNLTRTYFFEFDSTGLINWGWH